MTVKITFNARLPLKLTKRKKWIVASCPILDVHTQGETEAKAKKNLTEALSLFFISCFERGTLDAVLKNCGFSPAKKTTQAISPKQYVNVPIPFQVKSGSHQTACHA